MAKSLSKLLIIGMLGIILLISVEYIGFYLDVWIPMALPSVAWLMSSILTVSFLTYYEKQLKEQAVTMFGNYLSPTIAEHIWQQRDLWLQGGKPKPQKLETTILFSDIKGFTKVADEMEPDIFMDWLNQYLDEMTGIIIAHGGVVVRFIGDAILAAFGIPIPRQSKQEITNDAQNAVQCALAMEAKLAEMNKLWKEIKYPVVATRIGIHSGLVVSGSLGNKNHMEYTIQGDDVNIASRLESHRKESFNPKNSEFFKKPCRILIGDNTKELIHTHFELQYFDQFNLTCRSVTIYLVRSPGG